MMQGTILNFRSSVSRQTMNQMVIIVDSITSKEQAKELVGKSVVFKTPANKELKGKITAAHGNKGAVKALFETGMPGQSVGQKVLIN